MANHPDKRIVIIAGPNGAGKTTFARRFLATEGKDLDFLNADEIAAELCPEAPESVAIRAGRIMLDEIARRLDAGKSFAIETTLSGRAYARTIPKWRSKGYLVTLFFLSLPNPEGSIHRVAARVAQGGHHIPEDVIRRRFDHRNEKLLHSLSGFGGRLVSLRQFANAPATDRIGRAPMTQ